MTYSTGANRQRGFILATTLWMMAIVVLLTTMFHAYVEAQVNRALLTKRQQESWLDILGTANTVHYLLASRRMTLAGLTTDMAAQRDFIDKDGNVQLAPVGGELRMDGTPYKGAGSVFFSVQDQAGLLSVNSPAAPAILSEVLALQGSSQQARQLAAALADYIDENESRRLNGAEKSEYSARGLPAPSNWYLRSDAEISSVYGWSAWLASEEGAPWRDWISTNQTSMLNINTAPAGLLALVLNIDIVEAQRLVQAREEYPFRSLDGVAEALNRLNRWEDLRFRFFAGDRLELQLWCEGCNYSIVQSLRLTPNGLYGPWLVDYSYRSAVDREGEVREIDTRASASIFADALPVGG